MRSFGFRLVGAEQQNTPTQAAAKLRAIDTAPPHQNNGVATLRVAAPPPSRRGRRNGERPVPLDAVQRQIPGVSTRQHSAAAGRGNFHNTYVTRRAPTAALAGTLRILAAEHRRGCSAGDVYHGLPGVSRQGVGGPSLAPAHTVAPGKARAACKTLPHFADMAR